MLIIIISAVEIQRMPHIVGAIEAGSGRDGWSS